MKPAFNIASPYKGMAVAAKTKSRETREWTTDNSKSISGGKFSSLIDVLSGAGLRLTVMYIISSKVSQ